MPAEAVEVQRGTVVKFNDAKGYGFVKPDDGGPDAFLHYSSIFDMEGFRKVLPGQRVEFSLVTGDKGPAAVKVRLIEA